MKSTLLLHYLLIQKPLGYLLIFVGMIFEGDLFLFAAAFLAQQGFFDLGAIALVVFGGVILGDIFWYWVGLQVGRTSARIQHWIERLVRRFDGHLTDRQFRTILISKFTYGFHHALLVRIGMMRLDLSNFIRNDILATIVWVAVVGGAGYFSGFSYTVIRHYLRFVETGLLVSLLVFFALERLFTLTASRD